MADEFVTLELTGAPTLDEYARALASMRELLNALASQTAPGVEIEWHVEKLDSGSAISTFRGEARDEAAVRRVTNAYLNFGEALRDRDLPRLTEDFGPLAYDRGRELVALLNGHVPSIRFETALDEASIFPDDGALPARRVQRPRLPGAYGAVEGRVQTLTSRNTLRFTIYDPIHDRPVSCYLQPDQHELTRDIWDHLAIVEGWITRDPLSGRPTTARRIRAISRIEPSDENAWRAARGASPGGEPAEDIIREMRDGW